MNTYGATPTAYKYAVILDLTYIRDLRSTPTLGHGPRPLQRSSKPGLPARHITRAHRDRRNGGFHQVRSAAAEELPDIRAVMDPSTSCTLAGNAPWMNTADAFSRTLPSARSGHRSFLRPAGSAHRSLPTLLRQQHQITRPVFPAAGTSPLRSPGCLQGIIDAYRSSNARGSGKTCTRNRSPQLHRHASSLTELTLGRTLKRRAGHPGLLRPSHTSNGPTEAIGRLEHLRGSAQNCKNLTHLHHPSTPQRGFKLYAPNCEEPESACNQYIKGIGDSQLDGELCIGVPKYEMLRKKSTTVFLIDYAV